MPDGALDINISAADLARLKELPQQIETLATSACQALEAIRTGADAGNPVGALVAGLTRLGNEAGNLPAIEPLIAPIRDLASRLPAKALGDMEAAKREIDEVFALFGPLKDAISSGKIDQNLTEFIEKTLDQTQSLFTPGAEVTHMMKELEEFMRLFQVMLGWQHRPAQPEELAELISRALAGTAPDLLSAPAAALAKALAPVGELLPAGADLNRWRDLPAERLAFWHNIDLRVSAGATIDWRALETELHGELRLLIELRALRDRLLFASISNLARVNLSAFGQVAQAVSSIPAPRDFRLTPFLNGLRRQLEATAQRLEAWNPTEEEIRQLVRGLVDQLLAYIEQSPLGQLRALLIDFQQRVLNAIEALPFRGLALEAESALRRVAAAIEIIDPDLIRKPVHDFFGGIESKLDEFSSAAISNSVGKLWSGVEDTLNQVSTQIDSLRATLEGLVAQLQGVAQNVKPAMESIASGVTTIKTALDNFDLEPPASAVVEELHKLRDTVASLDVSSLPAPAVAALKTGAEFLRQIDIAGAVNPPLNEVLTKADPTPLLNQAAEKVAGASAQLKLLDPAILARDMDKPVDELLGALSRVGPEQFTRLLQDALKTVEDAVRALDFEQLLAPITRLYAEIAAKVDAVLDPEKIFTPLEALFKPVVDLIDGLQPSRFIERLQPHGGSLAEKIGSAAGPPAAITSANLRDALPPGPESEDDLFGFRIGDLLVPLIDLHRQLTAAFDRIDDGVLAAAGTTLRSILQGRLEALNPINVSLRIEAAFGAMHAEFDPAQVSARLLDAAAAYHDAVGKIARGAKQSLPPGDAAISARVLRLVSEMNPLTLIPERAQFDGIVNASLQVKAKVDLSALRAVFPNLSKVQALLPEFLRAPELTAASLRQALRDLDPAPLRVEINALFDRIGKRIVALKEIVFAAIAELGRVAEEFLLPLSPGALMHLANRLHAALKQQVLKLHPGRFKDEVQLVFTAVKRQLAAFDPALIVQELNGLREALIKKLRDLLAGLVPNAAPFHAMQARLAQLKPSQLLAPLVQTLKPVNDLVAALDPKVLFEPLIEAIARIREQTPRVIAELEAALDEVLAAFPEGGFESASVSVSVEVSTS